jgi:hypothetical protein
LTARRVLDFSLYVVACQLLARVSSRITVAAVRKSQSPHSAWLRASLIPLRPRLLKHNTDRKTVAASLAADHLARRVATSAGADGREKQQHRLAVAQAFLRDRAHTAAGYVQDMKANEPTGVILGSIAADCPDRHSDNRPPELPTFLLSQRCLAHGNPRCAIVKRLGQTPRA